MFHFWNIFEVLACGPYFNGAISYPRCIKGKGINVKVQLGH
jgi:hypothetical protein